MNKIGIILSTIEKRYSGVLCVPIEDLRRGYKYIENSDVSIESLISGINKDRYIEGLKNSSTPKLPLRHRW